MPEQRFPGLPDHGPDPPATADHETSLVCAAKRGDRAAFAALYQRHVDRVYRHCYYCTGNVTDAEDLTQQTFLQAWQAIRRFRTGEAPFIAWLLTIAQRLAVSHFRKIRSREVPVADETPADAVSTDPEAAVAAGIARDAVREAILSLRPERRQVIVLRFIEGFSPAEIAAALDMTPNHVYVVQHRALADLRRRLHMVGLDGDARGLRGRAADVFERRPSIS